MHYTGTIWRPPYEAASLLLEVTAGCTHHGCKFCTLYDELPFKFRLSPMDVVEQDVIEARDTLAQGGIAPSRAFLTGANPFALSAEKLAAISALIRRHIPAIETIGCFSRVTDITPKSDGELAALRECGYDGLTIGIETGDEQALRFMNKGYAAADIVAQCRKLDRAGISYSFFYLTGISGAGRGEAGARATAGICNQLHPRRIGANMLTIYPNSELYREIRRGAWREESEIEKYRELRALVGHLRIPVIFGALGASNAFQFQGVLPDDREEMLALLDRIIANAGEEALRRYREHLPHL